MSKRKQDEQKLENSAEDNQLPERSLYQVAVINFSRKEEVSPIFLKVAASPEEAENLVRQSLSSQWQTEDLEFLVKRFLD